LLRNTRQITLPIGTRLIEIVNHPDSFSECTLRLSCLTLVSLR
jgi:hypothetical protein